MPVLKAQRVLGNSPRTAWCMWSLHEASKASSKLFVCGLDNDVAWDLLWALQEKAVDSISRVYRPLVRNRHQAIHSRKLLQTRGQYFRSL